MTQLLVGFLGLFFVSSASAAAPIKVPCAEYLTAVLATVEDFKIFTSTDGLKIESVSENSDAANNTTTYAIHARAMEGEIAGNTQTLTIVRTFHGLGFVQNTYSASIMPSDPTYTKLSDEMRGVFQALLDNTSSIDRLALNADVVTGVTYEALGANQFRIQISSIKLTEGDIASPGPTLVIDFVEHHAEEVTWNTYKVAFKK